MKSLEEIRNDTRNFVLMLSLGDLEMSTEQIVNFSFNAGVKAAEERAQILVDAIIDVAGSMDNGWSETLYNHLETYKKSMELK